MARRLIDRNRRREARRQRLILDRLGNQFSGVLQRDISSAMADMVDRWEQTLVVELPRGFPDRIGAAYLQMADAAVRAFGSRILDQGKAAGLITTERKFIDFGQLMTRLALAYIAQEAIRRRIQLVTETTRRQIVTQVEQGYQAGLGTREIGKNIRDTIPAIARYRADTIARTETHGAANYGANEAAKATNLPLRREWLAAHDHRTRTVDPLIGDGDLYGHREADGQIVGMDQPFLIRRLMGGTEALMYPGDPNGSPGNVINCRCTVAFIVDDGIDDEPDEDAAPAPAPPPAASRFAYETATMPTTVAEATEFIKSNGIAFNARLDGFKIIAIQAALRAALETKERFDLAPLTGVGPVTRFGLRQIRGANAAISIAMMPDSSGAYRRASFLHLPTKFGDIKEYQQQSISAIKSAPKYEAAMRANLAKFSTTYDPEVLRRAERLSPGSFGWSISSMGNPADQARNITYHEYGHVLHLVNKEIGADINAFLKQHDPRRKGWANLLSEYSRTNDKEYVAEAFSLYMSRDKSERYRIHPKLLAIFEKWDRKNDNP